MQTVTTSSKWTFQWISPLGMVLLGILVVACWGSCESFGLRGYTTLLSGSSPTGEPIHDGMILLGLSYLLSYFMALIVAPALFLGAGLWTLWK